jgi:hypothetical protein
LSPELRNPLAEHGDATPIITGKDLASVESNYERNQPGLYENTTPNRAKTGPTIFHDDSEFGR